MKVWRMLVSDALLKTLRMYPSTLIKLNPFFCIILLGKGYVRSCTPLSLKHTLLHEGRHVQQPYSLNITKQELDCELYAFKELMREGYSFEQIARDELNSRFLSKYHLTLKEFKQLVTNLNENREK